MSHFWSSFQKPIFALAPMHDVTDAAFRRLVVEIAKPDVLFTEFVAVDGLVHAYSQEKMIQHYLRYHESERPIVAQIWGNNPEHFFTAAQLLRTLKFDGIDINMGCPDKKVVALGGGSALINDSARAISILDATREGAGDIPVSIKTRLGFQAPQPDFIKMLIHARPVALTIHGRTKKELSLVPAHWDSIQAFVSMAHEVGVIVLGNGDVCSYEDGLEKVRTHGVDGVMIGRGVFGNPWVFAPTREISLREKIQTLIRHLELFQEIFQDRKNVSIIKKHVRGYVQGFSGAREMRNEIMNAKTNYEMQIILRTILTLL